MKLEELVGKKLTEEQFDEAAGKKDASPFLTRVVLLAELCR